MVAVETGAIVGLDQLEPRLEVPVERQTAVVQMVKDPKTHSFSLPAAVADQASAKAGMTSSANSSIDRLASARVISPKAMSQTK